MSGGTGSSYTYTWTKADGTEVSKSTTINIPATGTYSLTIKDSAGCSVTYPGIVVPTKKANNIAVVKSAVNNLRVYPNPTGGDITVTSTNIIEKVVIMDMSGKTLKSKSNINSNEIKMKIGGFSEGAYFIKAYTVNGIETGQIIKK